MEKSQEHDLYNGGPSQLSNLWVFIKCMIIFMVAILAPLLWKNFFINYIFEYKGIYFAASKILFFVPILWAFKAWLEVKCHKYHLTSERLLEAKGIFTRTTGELELFRVKDMTFHEPFFLRILGLGDIILDTSDKSTPIVVLHAVKNPRPLMDVLRKNVINMRNKKGVRELDGV